MRDTSIRFTWLIGFVAIAVLLLAGQLYRLTVAESAAFAGIAESAMLRELPSYGPRGAIYDRKGRSLATSEPAFAAVLINQDPNHVAKILPGLARLLADGDEASAQEIEGRVTRRVLENKKAWLQYEPLTIQRNLSQEIVATFLERRGEFPGVTLVEESARHFPQGSAAGAIMGYVGRISEDELDDPEFGDYHVDEIVGKAGLELYYEKQLRGQPGHNSVLVDPVGRPISGFDLTPATPGNNLYLSLDLDLQRVGEVALAKQIEWIKAKNDPKANPIRGALVVQEVKTGAILAMVTLPTYDPNVMSHPTEEQLAALMEQPGALYNWTINGFAPGSTYKMATGLAGMEIGVIGPYERIECPATYWRFGNPRNWTGYDQGPADVARALAISCNPYFFEVGYKMGLDRFAAFVDQFGFGKRTGIDLPSESPGVNPTEETYEDRWYPGNVINVAIGQGDVLVTPLQLANYTATIAASGARYRPYLVAQIQDRAGNVVMERQPELLEPVQASAQSWERLQVGMRQTVTSAEGTAHLPFLGFPIPVAAKTGSAETSTGFAHALTVAYAPYDDPEIAVSVIIEGGSTGSWTAPIVRRVMAEYFGIDDQIPAGVPTYDAGIKPPTP